MRCFKPHSMVVHSDAATIRGTKSNGKMRSVPALSPYTLNVIPMFISARSAER